MQIAQDKQPADQHRGETHRTGQNRAPTASGHHGWTVVTTTGHGGSHGQAVVAATAVMAFPLPELLRFFLRRFDFPHDYCLVAAWFCL